MFCFGWVLSSSLSILDSRGCLCFPTYDLKTQQRKCTVFEHNIYCGK